MHTITVRLRAVDLAQVMTTMRRWLDENQVQPSLFRYDNVGDGELTVKLGFVACGDADVFAAAFCTQQAGGAAGRRRTPVLLDSGYAFTAAAREPTARLDGDSVLTPYRKPKALYISADGNLPNNSLSAFSR